MNATAPLELQEPLVLRRIAASPHEGVLTAGARTLLTTLHRQFNAQRVGLLAARKDRNARIAAGELPGFLPETWPIRDADWKIRPVPADLADRRVEITGPPDRKTVINALNAPVKVFMADFEDACAPTWDNLLAGQQNLIDAVQRRITFTDPGTGRDYRLNPKVAALIVRPRGWHLQEKHVHVDGEPVSGALFDFAVFLANNHHELRERGTAPYFYLPKLESHLEARLWNDVFLAAQAHLGMPSGTVRATVLIETLPAAFEMDEILFELRDHITGLNCGRWDYIFSFIKTFRTRSDFVLPDRKTITMAQPFLKSYVELLIKTCHRRHAYAMGGMAAQIPIRDDSHANAIAMSTVLADKQREAQAGHDGTWIAHPGLAAVAFQAFDATRSPHQLHVPRNDVRVVAADLLRVPEGEISEAGMRHNIRVGIRYLEGWLEGTGCVPLFGLMEDAATAEICRAQLWQWIHHEARCNAGRPITALRIDNLIAEEVDAMRRTLGRERIAQGSFATAERLFSYMVTRDEFDDFLTVPAYELIA